MSLKIKGKGETRSVVIAETGVVVGSVKEHVSTSEQRNRVTGLWETKLRSTWYGYTNDGKPVCYENSRARRSGTLKEWCRASIWGISDDV